MFPALVFAYKMQSVSKVFYSNFYVNFENLHDYILNS